MDVGTAMLIGTAVQGAGMGIQGQQGKKGHERNKELMGIQFQNQQALNQQGQNLQHEMWEKTNYPAQVEMLKRAGLNPALLYGKSGGGGATTGSQSGGSAASGSYSHAPYMDMGAISDMTRAMADIKLKEAQAKNLDADTEKKSGVETDLDNARIRELEAGINNKNAQTELFKADTEVKKVVKDYTLQQIDESYARMRNTLVETERNIVQYGVDKATANDKIKLIHQEWQLGELEKVLKAENINKTKAEIKEIHDKINREWVRLGLDKENIDLTKDKNKVAEFEAETKRAYPSVMNAIGHQIQGTFNKLGMMFGSRADAEYDTVKNTYKTHEKHKTVK